jgi:UDP-3-O-[3-hydroxymyristoyl] glucosamine N-acyltransferase
MLTEVGTQIGSEEEERERTGRTIARIGAKAGTGTGTKARIGAGARIGARARIEARARIGAEIAL